jgi:hypothetical protein
MEEKDDADDHISRRLDFKRLATPGQGLTLGRLYEVYRRIDKIQEVVSAIISFEYRIADTAYRWARGQEQPTRFVKEQQEDIKDLTNLYIETGLASGPQHAAQLIRDMEKRARAQARDHELN